MSTITLMDHEQVKLYYHEDSKIVHHIYGPVVPSDLLKQELNSGVELLKKYKANKWLSDNRHLEGHSEEDTEWVNNNWLPNAISAGWKYWALVVPESFMARVNMNQFVQSFYDMGVRVMVTTDPDEAMTWLEKVDRH